MELPASEARFTMLETVREYAIERLVSSGEEAASRRALAAYCLVLAEEGNPELSPVERSLWLSRCDLEIDNFRSALDLLFANKNVDWGLRLCMALFRFWDMREHMTEGRIRLENIVRLAGAGYKRERARLGIVIAALAAAQGDFSAGRYFAEQSLSLYQELNDRWGVASALNALGVGARDSGDYETAQSCFEHCLECWRALPDQIETARCLHNLANIAKIRGDYARAQTALREATDIFEGVGDRSGAAWSMNQRGDIEWEQGNVEAARECYRRALKSFRDADDRWGCARSLADLGHVHCERKEYKAAQDAYREALRVFAELGHKRGMARVLDGLACSAAAQRQAARALKLAGAAEHLRRLAGTRLPRPEQTVLDEHLSLSWKSLGEANGKRAWAEGSVLSIDDAIQYSLQEAS
jgi:tetratricopeptide (TPR) repeat protein